MNSPNRAAIFNAIQAIMEFQQQAIATEGSYAMSD